MKPQRRLAVCLAVTAAALVLATCSDARPRIERSLGWRLVELDQKTGAVSQKLALYCQVEFKDGIKNLQNLYVLNDNLQILWVLEASAFQTLNQDNRLWVGSSNFGLVPGEPVPNGKFRLLLNDRAGHQVSAELSFARPDRDPVERLPKAVRSNGKLIISPELKPAFMREIVLKDWSGSEISRHQVLADTISLDKLITGRAADGVQLYITDRYQDESLLLSSGPW